MKQTESNTYARILYGNPLEIKEIKGRSNVMNFTELYRSNVSNVYYYLLSRVRNPQDAEDLTSQTFVTALENLSSLNDPKNFTPWVFTIARNKATDFFRKNNRQPITEMPEAMADKLSAKPGLSKADQDLLLDLERVISRLSSLEQDYLRLRIVADLPFAEIAAILSEPETRIKKKYYRLLERLQAQVEE